MTEPIRFKVPGPELEKYLARVDHAPTGPFAVTAADLIAALKQNEGLRREVLGEVLSGVYVAEGAVRGLEERLEYAERRAISAGSAERFAVDDLRKANERAEQAERRADAADRTAARDAAHHISRRVSVNFLDGCDPLSAESVALAVDRQHRAWVDLSNKLAAIRRTLDE